MKKMLLLYISYEAQRKVMFYNYYIKLLPVEI